MGWNGIAWNKIESIRIYQVEVNTVLCIFNFSPVCLYVSIVLGHNCKSYVFLRVTIKNLKFPKRKRAL